MLQILFNVIAISIIIKKYFTDKPTIGLLIVYSLIAPRIEVGTFNFNIHFISIIVFLISVLYKNNFIITKCKLKWGNRYACLVVYLYLMYTLSWVIHNGNDLFTVLQATVGAFKNLLMLWIFYEMNRNFSIKTIVDNISKCLVFLCFVNLITSIVQLLNVNLGIEIVNFRKDALASGFCQEVTKYGSFTRCFGLMSYPMMLAIYSLSVFCICWVDTSLKKKVRTMGLIFSFLCGLLSASKTFLVGLPTTAIIILISRFYFQKDLQSTLKLILISLTIICFVFLFYYEIGILMKEYLGENFLYYWSFLGNVSEVFASRYSADATVLAYMPAFIEKYWLFGVGTASLEGELAIDSAFFTILHHGGVICLIPVVVFLFLVTYSSIIKMSKIPFILCVIIIITGFGFQTWICQDISLWMLYIVFLFLDKKQNLRKEEVNGVCL